MCQDFYKHPQIVENNRVMYIDHPSDSHILGKCQGKIVADSRVEENVATYGDKWHGIPRPQLPVEGGVI